jgi:D-glycero-D-manno-heptose 1,7-bisphosphate phosphatase
VIVVTNQSGIARGFFTMADYERVQATMAALLAEAGAHIDAAYVCPHYPDISGPCACRKPGTLLFERAAIDRGLDLAHSAYAGDRYRDVQPGVTLGGLGILVPNQETPGEEVSEARAKATVAANLDEAVTWMLAFFP